MPLKTTIYSAAKAIGLFQAASHLTRNSLNILCYHGFSFSDEHLFRPKLFQTAELFAQRVRHLQRAGYRSLSLDEGMRRLRAGSLGRKDVVITVDDGFYSVAALAAPILRDAGFTATIYVTTYYVVHNNPIFRIALQYLFWKTAVEVLAADDLLDGAAKQASTKGEAGEPILWQLIEHGEQQLDEAGRVTLAGELARRLDVDFDEIVASRRLTLMNAAEVADLAGQGFDIQLHTHRHRFPEDAQQARRELDDNRQVLAPLTGGRPLTHLCYPSGEWSPAVWPSLESRGVVTATTCDPGLNTPATPPYALGRFLDFQPIPQIVFEAEVSGFGNLLRRAAGRVGLRAGG
jgi:Polysaccharide deacetylase.